MPHQKILMCAPDHFGVDYVINPWMEGNKGHSDKLLAYQQWAKLKQELSAQTGLELVAQQPGFPDQVFTANAGFVIGKQAIVSRFSAKERQGEEAFFRDWFKANGFDLVPWPDEIFFEGAGDALLDRGQKIIWAGHGFRSNVAAGPLMEKIFNRKVIPLRLVDPRFYHLDTCFCPLEGGLVMYFPAAFDAASQKAITDNVAAEKLIAVENIDALKFCCNAVDLNRHVFMNGASDSLRKKLQNTGFTPVIVPLSEFMKAGGAAKCLTLKLVED